MLSVMIEDDKLTHVHVQTMEILNLWIACTGCIASPQ